VGLKKGCHGRGSHASVNQKDYCPETCAIEPILTVLRLFLAISLLAGSPPQLHHCHSARIIAALCRYAFPT
jgi:hypothetical protein